MKKTVEWFNNPNLIVNMMIGLLAIGILISQTVAIRSGLDFQQAVNQLFNDNSVYTIYLVYFVSLNFKFGKRHFDALSVVMFVFQSIILLTSLLNIIQAVGLISIFDFIMHVALWLYISNSLIKRTSFWKNLNLEQVSFTFIKNIDYFYIVVASSLIILILGLIGSLDFNYVLIILLDCLVYIGVARYLYLFSKYFEDKNKQEEVEEEIIVASTVKTKKKKKGDVNG